MDDRATDWPADRDVIEAATRFLDGLPHDRPVAVAFHGDVDGLAAAALAIHALERTGRRVEPIPAGKGEQAHADAFRRRLRALRPPALIVLDMGSRAGSILEGTPTLVIDHHVPAGLPDGAVLVSSAGRRPEAPTSYLALLVFRTIAPIDDLAWVALLGVVADLGPRPSLPDLAAVASRHRAVDVREAVSLLNAARRAPEHDVATALAVLLRGPDPAGIARGGDPAIESLRTARAVVNREASRCARTRPRFAGDYALLRFASPALVHGLVAARWTRRLPEHVVIAANDGYVPGRVHFSARTQSAIDVVSQLRSLPVRVSGDLGHGHPAASGGILPVAEFELVLAALGFADGARRVA